MGHEEMRRSGRNMKTKKKGIRKVIREEVKDEEEGDRKKRSVSEK